MLKLVYILLLFLFKHAFNGSEGERNWYLTASQLCRYYHAETKYTNIRYCFA